MRGTRSFLVAGLGVVAVSGVSSCALGPTGAIATSTVTKLVTVTATAAPPSPSAVEPPPTPAGPATTISRDGTYVVGTDIAPGTYKTAGPSNDSPFCSWSRLDKLTSGTDFDAVIKNGNEPGPGFVTIEPSDVAFYSQFCQPWQRIG